MIEKNKVGKFIRKNLSIIVVSIIAIFYMFWGSVELLPKKLNWWELICFISTTLVFGISITNLIGESGFSAGKLDEGYLATRSMLIEWCDLAIGFKQDAIKYVDKQIDKEIEEERRLILHRAGIHYNDIFDNAGKALITCKSLKASNKYSHRQKKSIRKAINIKKYEFTLFAYSSTKIVGRKREQSEMEFRSRGIGKDFAIRIFLAVISGSIMFSFTTIDIASVIYSFFQMVLWCASGVLKRVQNFNFIAVHQRENDLDRIHYLKDFMASIGYKEQWVNDKLVPYKVEEKATD